MRFPPGIFAAVNKRLSRRSAALRQNRRSRDNHLASPVRFERTAFSSGGPSAMRFCGFLCGLAGADPHRAAILGHLRCGLIIWPRADWLSGD